MAKSKAKKETPEVKPVEVVTETTSQDELNTFENIEADIRQGKKVKLAGHAGYFILNGQRLEQRSDEGAFIDDAPLYVFQDKKGWEVIE